MLTHTHYGMVKYYGYHGVVIEYDVDITESTWTTWPVPAYISGDTTPALHYIGTNNHANYSHVYSGIS